MEVELHAALDQPVIRRIIEGNAAVRSSKLGLAIFGEPEVHEIVAREAEQASGQGTFVMMVTDKILVEVLIELPSYLGILLLGKRFGARHDLWTGEIRRILVTLEKLTRIMSIRWLNEALQISPL